MDPETLKSNLKRLADEAIPADEVDLWPAIRKSLETGKPLFRPGDASMNARIARHRKIRLSALAAVCLLVLAALITVTPAGRAWAQNVLQFFSRIGNTAQVPTLEPASLVEITPPFTAIINTATPWPTTTPEPGTLLPFHQTCGSLPHPRCTLEQIKALVDFPVYGLSALPEGFAFSGATGGPVHVILMYEGERGALYLAQSPANQDDLQNWEIAADTLVEAVPIGGQPGEYVRGGWFGLGLPQAGALAWELDTARQTLRWEQGNIRYTLWFYAYKTGNGPLLDKDGLVALASGLTRQPPAAPVASLAGMITLQQAESMAGFTAVEPGWLPTGYSLAGASYDPERNAICLHYRYRLEASAPTLTLFESFGWLPAVDDIKIKTSYNGQPLDIPVTIASWPIDGVENGTATWAANGVNLGAVCGGIELTNNKALLWRAKGMNFILGTVVDQFQGRGFLSNLEMQRAAMSLSGVSAPPVDRVDLERLLSPATLKSLTSFTVKTPTRMFVDFHFDHAAYFPPGDQANPFTQSSDSERAILVYLGSPLGDGSDGRYTHLFISQEAGAGLPTLEELALGGGYEAVTVNQQPALFQQSCWDDPLMGAPACLHILTWLENGVWIEIDVLLEKALSKETLIAIAEGLR